MPRTYCLIDISALRKNLCAVRSKVGSDVKLMFVVKADAYGHGAVDVARASEDIVDMFGVATADEGAELRKSGVALPIVILGNTVPADYFKLPKYGLAATVFSQESARLLDRFAISNGVILDVHMAIDTGMGRIGFKAGQERSAVRACMMKGLRVKGIFTHFACADREDKTYTLRQAAELNRFVSGLERYGVSVPYIHAANSCAILDGRWNYSMVRAGIIAYGLHPCDDVNFSLSPVLSWHTEIVHLKTIEDGERVSYGAEYVARGRRVIATLPVGYADGYPRSLSRNGYVLIRGEKAPIAGRICMDQFMVDVTEIKGARLYDDVVLIGSQENLRISAEEIAELAGTINYEMVCRIGKRVPRLLCGK